MSRFYVEVVRIDGMEIVKRIGPMSERRAEMAAKRAIINISGQCFVRIVDAKKGSAK